MKHVVCCFVPNVFINLFIKSVGVMQYKSRKKLPKKLIENNHALESGRFTGRYCCCLKRVLQRIFKTMIWQLK